jgi:hypothetical protein
MLTRKPITSNHQATSAHRPSKSHSAYQKTPNILQYSYQGVEGSKKGWLSLIDDKDTQHTKRHPTTYNIDIKEVEDSKKDVLLTPSNCYPPQNEEKNKILN